MPTNIRIAAHRRQASCGQNSSESVAKITKKRGRISGVIWAGQQQADRQLVSSAEMCSTLKWALGAAVRGKEAPSPRPPGGQAVG